MKQVPGLNRNGATDEDVQPFFMPDKSKAYWTGIRSAAYGIFSADLVGGSYVNEQAIALATLAPPFTGKTVLIGEANVAEVRQGWLMYMMCGIAQSESDGRPRDVHLKVFVARKSNKCADTIGRKAHARLRCACLMEQLAAPAGGLHGRAGHRTERTEHAAVAWLRGATACGIPRTRNSTDRRRWA